MPGLNGRSEWVQSKTGQFHTHKPSSRWNARPPSDSWRSGAVLSPRFSNSKTRWLPTVLRKLSDCAMPYVQSTKMPQCRRDSPNWNEIDYVRERNLELTPHLHKLRFSRGMVFRRNSVWVESTHDVSQIMMHFLIVTNFLFGQVLCRDAPAYSYSYFLGTYNDSYMPL